MYLKPKTLVNLTALGSIPKPEAIPQTGSKKYVFTCTNDVTNVCVYYYQEHPVKESLNWLNPLNGVSVYNGDCYQFISLDETRSAFKSSGLDVDAKWTDYLIPQGKQIRTVETLLWKVSGILCGLKWIGDDGAVLVAVGAIDDPDKRYDTEELYVLQTLTLNHNQRLVGVRSDSNG